MTPEKLPIHPLTGLEYLWKLLRFSVDRHPVVLANFALAAVSVLLDLLAIASVMPLTLAATGKEISSDSAWIRPWDWTGVKPTLSAYLLFFAAAFTLRLITQFLNQVTSITTGKKIQADLSSGAFSRVVSDMSFREIDSRSAGYFISLAGDETARAGAMMISVNQLVATVLLSGVYFAALLYISSWLGIGVIAFLVIVMITMRSSLARIQQLSARQLTEAKAAHSVFLDALNGLRSIRALSAESFVVSRYTEIIYRYTGTNARLEILSFASKVFPAIVLLVCASAVTAAGYLDFKDVSKIALLVTAIACLLRFFPAAGQVLSLLIKLSSDLRAASDVTVLLEESGPAGFRHGKSPAGNVQLIQFSDVSFCYTASRPVLRRFNVKICAGKSYAIIGPSGSGKSTVFDLLLGFYESDSGVILVNEIPVGELDSRMVRSKIALISQQVAILNDSVANNIRFGSTATEEDIRKACKAVCIDEYIDSLEHGYETRLSFHGSNLSGGQRQRIAIARGLVRHPDVLLLDESTTGLDVDVRDRVVDNIIDIFRTKIVIFSTHDKDVIERVDEVIQLPGIVASPDIRTVSGKVV
ncbi:MAG TPA: ABC transporter ATP-binding protein [Burkholderiales bacterium]|nr:ABC transporter ATP-binding protein [Burkholderiales bacterium]